MSRENYIRGARMRKVGPDCAPFPCVVLSQWYQWCVSYMPNQSDPVSLSRAHTIVKLWPAARYILFQQQHSGRD